MKASGISGITLILIVSMIGGCICIDVGCWPEAKEKFERTEDLVYELSLPQNFRTETTNGSITVRGEDTDQTSVRAVITGRADTQEEARRLAEETKLYWEEANNILTLAIQKPEHPKHCSVSVSLDISLPRQTALNLKTTNGKIIVSEIKNNVIAKTTNGRVELHTIDGRADAGTTNGKIQADQVTGDILCHTTNGKISCSGLLGNLSADTTNGSVEVAYEISALPDRNIHIKTTNGSVNVNLPPEFAGKTEISTTNGKIHCDRPVTVSGQIDKHRLTGSIGEGNGQLYIKTTNGSIHIR